MQWKQNKSYSLKKKGDWNYTKVLPNYQLIFIVYHNPSRDIVLEFSKGIQSPDSLRKVL